MALTYQDSSALMQDQTFVGRVKVGCLQYADYIVNEAPSVAAHNTRYRWAQNTMNDPDAVAAKLAPTVVMDPNVQSAGAAIDDATLQTAVETAVNKLM
jgi:hypothetical protein